MKTSLSLDSLLVLDAISRRGSFAAAADELHRVPSSITYTIQKLEENLDITLFDRRGHRAHLTPAGEALLREGRELLNMAAGVERNVKRIASGWESELRIAVGDLIPQEKILGLCDEFYRVAPETRLRLSTEVLGGTWDALVFGRADLVIGAPASAPSGGGYSMRQLGQVDFVFAVAPDHPLAKLQEPLANEVIRSYRAVAAADSSRGLAPRTVGLLPGQNVLTVPDLYFKRLAQMRGLGVGHLPRHLIADDLASGRLVEKLTEDGSGHSHELYYAWRTRHKGNALTWFKTRLNRAQSLSWFSERKPKPAAV